MPNVIEEARFILTDVRSNHNKWWSIELYDNDDVATRWGRVGYDGQSKSFAGAGRRLFDSKCADKRAGGYRPQQILGNSAAAGLQPVSNTHLEELAAEQIETNSPLVRDLIAHLAQANVHSILSNTTLSYDASRGTFATPLGIVTREAIDEARRLITQIGGFVHAGGYDRHELIEALNQYLMLVPQNVGMGRPDPRRLYPDLAAVQAQNDLLDSLQASVEMATVQPEEEKVIEKPRLFDVRLERVEDGAEIDRIRRKYRATRQSMHACNHLDVEAIYQVRLGSMSRAFDEHGRAVGNIMELWHGTRVANLLSILRGGLQVAPPRSAHVTGRMFGNGLYFSDQSTKALNYSFGYWNGNRDERCFMFLADVALGRPYTPKSWTECQGWNQAKPGYDSTFARANVSGVANNEMVVYRACQVDLRYLVEFDPEKRNGL